MLLGFLMHYKNKSKAKGVPREEPFLPVSQHLCIHTLKTKKCMASHAPKNARLLFARQFSYHKKGCEKVSLHFYQNAKHPLSG